MPRVIVVGGGIVGLSTAWQLLQRGCRDIIVCERAKAGQGSTGRASGGIRQQFANDTEIRMAVESVAFWERFDAAFDAEMRFDQCGYLYLLTTPALLAATEHNVARQQACGAPSRMLDPAEIAAMAPALDLEGVLAGSFCPTDGRAFPLGAVAGLARALRAQGVEIRENCDVTAVHQQNGRVTGVTAGGDRLAADSVVNAGGPDAAQVARMAGLDLPVRPVRMHQFVTAAIPDIAPHQPVLVEPETTLFAAREGAGMLLGMRKPDETGEQVDVDWEFLPDVLRVAARRIPSLAGAEIVTAWAGLVEMSPDHVGIIGPVPEIAGFVCANGLSGHGFMLSPAVGRLAAAYVLDGELPPAAFPGIDPAVLSPLRFRNPQ